MRDGLSHAGTGADVARLIGHHLLLGPDRWEWGNFIFKHQINDGPWLLEAIHLTLKRNKM